MKTTRNRVGAWLLIAAAVVATAGPTWGQRGPVRPPEVRGVIKTVDAGTIAVTFPEGRNTASSDKSYTLAKDVEVVVGDGNARRIFKAARLTDLTPGVTVTLGLAADQKTVESIVAECSSLLIRLGRP